MSSLGRNGVPARKQRCRRACKQCRQAKVKCGMDQLPCARCQRNGYNCENDPMFRRRKNQERFKDLEERIQKLQQAGSTGSLGLSAAAPVDSASVSTYQFGESHDLSNISSDPAQFSTESFVGKDLAPCGITSYYSVRDIRLSAQDAKGLFAKYFAKYHVHCPFISPNLEPEECFRMSEILFWAIVSVAARESQPGSDLSSRLCPYLSELLGGTIFGGVMTLGTVQAMLLLCLWPPFNVMLWGDKSMMLSNLAVSGAMFLGLHKFQCKEEYANMVVETTRADGADRACTWVACLAIAQNLTMESGLPCTLPFSEPTMTDTSGAALLTTIPVDLLHYYYIQKHAYDVFASLPEWSHIDTDLSLSDAVPDFLRQADSALTEFRLTHLSNMSPLNRLRFASVKLLLNSMWFHIPVQSAQRKEGVINAYSAAEFIIESVVSEDRSSDILSCSPRTTFRTLLLASCVICKVLHSGYSSEVDTGLGKMLFNTSLLCIRQQAVHYKNFKDMPIRCADLMKEFWHLSEMSPALNSKPPELAVQTRFGASPLYHYLAVWFDRRALNRGNRKFKAPDSVSLQQAIGLGVLTVPDLDAQIELAEFGTDFVWAPELHDL